MNDPERKRRAFISYSHEDRVVAAQLKELFTDLNIQAFLAHEDLEVSDEWRERILEELRSCEIFAALLSSNFLASRWAPQEVGFIISRPDVLIAPLSIDGTRSFGFISHLQSPRIPKDGLTPGFLVGPLARRLPRVILPVLIQRVASARGFRVAEERMQPLVPLFELFTPEEAETLASASVENNQIWPAYLCHTKYLPEFLRIQGENLSPRTRRALEYQLKHQQWYNE